MEEFFVNRIRQAQEVCRQIGSRGEGKMESGGGREIEEERVSPRSSSFRALCRAAANYSAAN